MDRVLSDGATKGGSLRQRLCACALAFALLGLACARETPATKTLPQEDAAGSPYSRRVAIVIGIDDYLEWPELAGAEEDARRVAAALREGDFDEVIELYGRSATRQDILSTLGGDVATRMDAKSLALVYFAGHGHTETLANGEKRGYILPVDSHPSYVFATGISIGTLRELANRLPAKHVYFAVDSCYSDAGLARGMALHEHEATDSLAKLASEHAVDMLNASNENPTDVDSCARGLFTTYFLRALSGEADAGGDGWVTAGELGAWVAQTVSAASDGLQTPQSGSLLGTGEVVFRVR